MTLFSRLMAVLTGHPTHPRTDAAQPAHAPSTPRPQGMPATPSYRGRAIFEWNDDIARLKRDGDLDAALALARGCLDAMTRNAITRPDAVMEFYVIQVAIIQRKQHDHRGEIDTISSWLRRGLPASRDDHRLELRKRLAKANELLARREGRDSAPHRAEWLHLVDLGKQVAQPLPTKVTSTGRTAMSAQRRASAPRAPAQRWVPSTQELLVREFVAVDFETANRRGGASACQIALVRVRDGAIIDRFSTLLKPPTGFDHFEFTSLHGIDARHVRSAPAWPDVASTVARFSSNAPVYAHNATFDARVWRELDEAFGTTTLPPTFFCSYRTAQRIAPELDNHKLPTVARHFAPEFTLQHHEATSDAEACARIIVAMQRQHLAR